jgi:hypothetical protein
VRERGPQKFGLAKPVSDGLLALLDDLSFARRSKFPWHSQFAGPKSLYRETITHLGACQPRPRLQPIQDLRLWSPWRGRRLARLGEGLDANG